MLPLLQSLKRSPLQENFVNVFKINQKDNSLISVDGMDHFKAMLDVQNMLLMSGQHLGTVNISLTPQRGWFDQHISSYQLKVGYNTKIQLRASIRAAGEEIKSFKPGQRDCYFPADMELDFFTEYTQSDCLTECKLRAAVQELNCAPLDMFFLFNETSTVDFICSNDEELRFQYIFAHLNTLDCGCLEDCEQMEIYLSVSTLPIDGGLQCRDTAKFNLVQNKGSKTLYHLMESARLGYLLGWQIDDIYCATKMENDVVILEISNYEEVHGTKMIPGSTLFFRFGVIGKIFEPFFLFILIFLHLSITVRWDTWSLQRIFIPVSV